MPTIGAQEIFKAVPKAVLQGNQVFVATAGRPLTPEKQLANKAIEQRNNEQAADVNKKPQERPVYGDAPKQKIEKNILGTQVDAVGNRTRTPAENNRFNQMTEESQLIQTYLEKGYDSLNGVILSGNRNAQEVLRNRMLAEFKRRPLFAAELKGKSDVQQAAYVERILKEDKSFSDEVQKIFEELQKKEIADPITGDNGAEATLQKAKDNEQVKKDRITEIDTGLADITAKQADFDRSGSFNTWGAKAQQIKFIESQTGNLQTDILKFNDELIVASTNVERFEKELEKFKGGTGSGGRNGDTIVKDLADARIKVNRINQEIENRNLLLKSKTDLENEEKKLAADKTKLDTEKTDINTKDMPKLTAEVGRRQADLDKLIRDRAQQEQQLITGGYERVFSAASTEWMDKEIDSIEAILQADAQKGTETASTDAEKKMYKDFQERWLGKARIRKRGFFGHIKEKYRPINRKKVEEDYRKLMDKGPEELMREMMENTVNGVVTNQTEVNALMNNKDFVDNMKPKLVTQLVARKITTGGLSPEDIHEIVFSDWGGKMIDQALNKNEEFRKAVEDINEKGGLTRHKWLERVGQVVNNKGLLWVIPALFMAGSMLASKEDVTEDN